MLGKACWVSKVRLGWVKLVKTAEKTIHLFWRSGLKFSALSFQRWDLEPVVTCSFFLGMSL